MNKGLKDNLGKTKVMVRGGIKKDDLFWRLMRRANNNSNMTCLEVTFAHVGYAA